MDVVVNGLPSVPRGHSRQAKLLGASVAVFTLLAVSLSFVGVAAAGGETVTICHSTGSSNNPYVTNHPAAAGDVGGHNDHNGPVWTPTLVGSWGDIIPPFHYGAPAPGGTDFAGKNWSTLGQEVWANKCGAVNPDLQLLKTSTGDDVAGGTGSYFLNVKNIGTATATGPLTVTDTFPTGVVATVVTGVSWTCALGGAGASISCTYNGNLAPGVSAAQITVSVNWVTAGSMDNSASVTVLAEDPSANNTGRNITVIAAAALGPDLRMVKTSSGDDVVGESGSYYLDVKNIGTSPRPGSFTVTDTMPTGVVATSVSGTGWTCSLVGAGTGISCGYTSALPENTAAPTITVSVNWVTAGSKLNSAHVTELVREPTANNTGQNTTVISSVPPALTPDLQLLKTSSGGATAGTTGNYFLNVKNIGSGPAVGPFTVTDTMPAGVVATAVSGTDWTCEPVGAGGSISCDYIGDLAADGAAPTITVSVNWTSDGSKLNSAHVTELAGEPAGNNTGQNTTVIAALPDPTATVEKKNDADGDGSFNIAEDAATVFRPVLFRLSITNTSPYAINVGQIIDDSVWIDQEPQGNDPTSYSCLPVISNLAPSASADCDFTVDSYSPADGLTKSNVATVTLTKYQAVRSLRRINAAAIAAPFTATSNVSTVTTKVPATRVTALAPTVTQSQCANGVASTPSYVVPVTPGVVYSPAVGGLGVPGGSATVTATAAPGFVLTNPGASPFTVGFGALASCSGPPPPPPPPVGVTPVPPVVPPPPPAPAPDGNIGVGKSGPGSARPGDELIYTIDVTNVAGTPVTGVTVTDVLPTGLFYSSAAGAGFTCANAGQAITCVYGGPALAVGEKASIIVRALLDETFSGKTIANIAVVDPGRADTTPADNSSTATTTVAPAPLSGGGGGTAEQPPPAAASPKPVARGDTGGAGAIPFTGANSTELLRAAVTLLLLGLFLVLATRRRTSTE